VLNGLEAPLVSLGSNSGATVSTQPTLASPKVSKQTE